ncbi:MAG TPA: hypothetical protein VKA14_09360, partial [Gammaproteobacteria bacterium]|nr:hypothetical protein [Gammaproteobacteria bacterium]
ADLDVVMQNLEGQHQDMARAWSALEPYLAAPETAAADLAGFGRSVKTFCLLYRSHIEQEEAECFTHAPGLLDAQTLERIGKAMAARRNTGS